MSAMVLPLALGLLCLAGPAAAASVFADLNLEEAVRRAAAKPEGELTAADLAGVRELVIPGGSVLSLGGIDKLVNLARLDLAKNPVRDIGPLAGLTKLADLDLSDTFVTDFKPLASLRSLKKLRLENLGLSDISFLSGLTNLEHLSLGRNRIVNLEPLQSLLALKYLALEQNQITSVAPLRRNAEAGGLGSGDEVRIADNPLTSGALLADIPFLEGRGVKVSR